MLISERTMSIVFNRIKYKDAMIDETETINAANNIKNNEQTQKQLYYYIIYIFLCRFSVVCQMK